VAIVSRATCARSPVTRAYMAMHSRHTGPVQDQRGDAARSGTSVGRWLASADSTFQSGAVNADRGPVGIEFLPPVGVMTYFRARPRSEREPVPPPRRLTAPRAVPSCCARRASLFGARLPSSPNEQCRARQTEAGDQERNRLAGRDAATGVTAAREGPVRGSTARKRSGCLPWRSSHTVTLAWERSTIAAGCRFRQRGGDDEREQRDGDDKSNPHGTLLDLTQRGWVLQKQCRRTRRGIGRNVRRIAEQRMRCIERLCSRLRTVGISRSFARFTLAHRASLARLAGGMKADRAQPLCDP
jgi:hypothetical protein